MGVNAMLRADLRSDVQFADELSTFVMSRLWDFAKHAPADSYLFRRGVVLSSVLATHSTSKRGRRPLSFPQRSIPKVMAAGALDAEQTASSAFLQIMINRLENDSIESWPQQMPW